MDTDRSGFIELSEVRSLLRKVYKKDPPPREVDKFIKFFDRFVQALRPCICKNSRTCRANSRNQDGRVSWEEFASGFEAVKGAKACD